MAKKAKQSKTSSKPTVESSSGGNFFTTRPRWQYDLAAIVVMYFVTLAIFWPYVIEDTRFSATHDAAAARAWNDVGDEIAQTEKTTPLWNPYVFIGFPSYGSLSYHPDTWLNPVEDVAKVAKYLFGVHPLNRQIFYYFLSGVAMFLFARGVGIPIWGALLAGIVFLLNPYNISLAEAGHGSKHWTIALMPLVLLMAHRTLTKRRLLDIGLFALALAAQFLSLHVQIVYYTLLMTGLYALVWFIIKLVKKQAESWRGLGGFAAGGLLGLGTAFYLYWPIYVFQKFSIRGAAPLRAEASATGGLDWTYATNWSLHPLELMQLFFPGFYGLGGSEQVGRGINEANILNYNLYWGWMPFTQSSLYMGIIPLALAIIAIALLWKKRGVVQWMTIASVVGIVVSFGRFLPVLYGPMYHFLPFFAKFRVPSMAMVVPAVGIALLAGFGLHEVIRLVGEARSNEAIAKKWKRIFLVLTGIAGLGVLAGLFGGSGGPWFDGFLKEGELQRYGTETATMLVALRWTLFTKSLLITALYFLGFSALGLVAFSTKGNVRTWGIGLAAAAVLFTTVDLAVLGGRFLHPVKMNDFQRALTATPVQNFFKQKLAQAEEPFRVFPLGNGFQDNTYMYHRIPSIGGYAATKLRVYQDLLDYALHVDRANSFPDLTVAGMMNAKYLIVPGQLPSEFTLTYADSLRRQYVYENPSYQPRAWFVDQVRYEDDLDAAMNAISSRSFNPSTEAIVSGSNGLNLGPAGSERSAMVPAASYKAHGFKIATRAEAPGFLVISEIWYPQGWKALVDGEETPIYRTNYALRGIVVPAGQHTVEMIYDPPEVHTGYTISIISLLIILGMIGGHVAMIRLKGSPAVIKESSEDVVTDHE